MIRNRLAAMVVLGLMTSGAAVASDDFDDRWYVSGTLGNVWADNDRGIRDHALYAVGLGKYINADWSLELQYGQDKGKFTNRNASWRNRELSLTSRHFFTDNQVWRPYLSWGVGALRHRATLPTGGDISGTNLALHAGGGLQAKISDRVNIRTGLDYRYDMNDKTVARSDGFGDLIASVGVTVALGRAAPPPPPPAAPAPPPPAAPPPPVAEPPCPPARPGQIVGPDGCPIDVVIDLRGVNFDFDRSTLRPESIATLDEAVKILKQYDVIRVEVAGHTCNIGSAEYNQGLSERRARVVYDYLVNNGIAQDRLNWVGYGLTQPIASNATRDGREENRRTELRVRND
jgi:OmpA-OmpF porin, OOP family